VTEPSGSRELEPEPGLRPEAAEVAQVEGEEPRSGWEWSAERGLEPTADRIGRGRNLPETRGKERQRV
jgi:hypothetical protein